ncbi:hypothetical protein XU18_4253 [Perkinsela sp. CCAP 1560/4]|nr:hypothetical protein XU18_4253 [Perkinsela sp. CCAP 1560/4]|eukprot:KNH04483.1 hypothetical protein XU18_4253 [Perkinsela sp. CCAP 1560/4]
MRIWVRPVIGKSDATDFFLGERRRPYPAQMRGSAGAASRSPLDANSLEGRPIQKKRELSRARRAPSSVLSACVATSDSHDRLREC